jgi:hypothetical protein
VPGYLLHTALDAAEEVPSQLPVIARHVTNAESDDGYIYGYALLDRPIRLRIPPDFNLKRIPEVLRDNEDLTIQARDLLIAAPAGEPYGLGSRNITVDIAYLFGPKNPIFENTIDMSSVIYLGQFLCDLVNDPPLRLVHPPEDS